MKTRIFILSSLLCLCGTMDATASECMGAGCNIEPLSSEESEWKTPESTPAIIVLAKPTPVAHTPTWMESDPDAAAVPTNKNQTTSLSEDLCDVHGDYDDADSVKLVDWSDGVPVWDNSINCYKYKDFSDWFLKSSPETYLRQSDIVTVTEIDPIELYKQNMEDVATTRARVEELLAPRKPSADLWFNSMPAPKPEYVAQDMTEIVAKTFSVTIIDDGCPFETETECKIWRRKPAVRETVSPRSPRLRDASVADFVYAANYNKHITANEPVAAPLLERYKMLMRSAQMCCTDGMAYALKQAGASDGLVYKFLSDDANFYGFGSRCLMMTDHDLDSQYPNTATSVVAADVRNGCLCRGRQWFNAMLAPFQQVYNEMPEFMDAQFNYTYKDGLQREITVSVNNDVQNVLWQLSQCP